MEDTDFLRRGKSFGIPLFPTQKPRLWPGWDGGDPHQARANADRAGGKTNLRHQSSYILLSSTQLLWKKWGEIQDLALLSEGQSVFPHGILSLAGDNFLALWITISTKFMLFNIKKTPTIVYKKINRPSPPNPTPALFPSQEEKHNGKVLTTINSKLTHVCMERLPNISG